MIFKLTDGNVAAAVDSYGFIKLVLRNTELVKCIPKGRTDENPQFLTGGDRKSEVLKGKDGTVNDAFAGVS